VHTSMQVLRTRVDRYVRAFPHAVRDDTAAYFRTARGLRSGPSVVSKSVPDLAYWLRLPQWISSFLPGTSQHRKHVVEEILWGQYCLYLTFRIEDDLRDGDADSQNLRVAARLFRKESRVVFSTLFRGTSPFWQFYENAISTTSSAIRQVDRAQRTKPENLYPLSLYAKVARVFQVGSNAMCRLSQRMDLFRRISRFTHELAIAEQILDDIRDMTEDAERGCLNYAARECYNAARMPFTEPAIRIAWGFLTTGISARLLHEVEAHIASARTALMPLHIPGTRTFLRSYVVGIRLAERQLEGERRRWDRRGATQRDVPLLYYGARTRS
jgi:hypothetical protein